MIDYILSRDKEDLRDFKYSAPVVTTIPTSADIRIELIPMKIYQAYPI